MVKYFILIAVWLIFGKEIVVLAVCLLCSDYGAVALHASFFPFGVLDERYQFLIIAFLSIENKING